MLKGAAWLREGVNVIHVPPTPSSTTPCAWVYPFQAPKSIPCALAYLNCNSPHEGQRSSCCSCILGHLQAKEFTQPAKRGDSGAEQQQLTGCWKAAAQKGLRVHIPK